MDDGKILESWKEIAAYLKRNIRTCQMWEREMGLPIHRLDGSPKARVFAYKDELDRWLDEKLSKQVLRPDAQQGRGKIASIFSSRSPLILALAVIVMVLAAAASAWLVFFRHGGARPGSRRFPIAVISFENQTGDKAYDYLSKVVPNLLITDLEQSGYFSVTTWERLRDLLKNTGKGDSDFIDSDIGFELCQKDAVEIIVVGTLAKAGDTFVTDAKVMDVATKRLLGTASSRGDKPDSILKTQVDDLSRQIAKRVGISERKIATAGMRIEGMTTSSLEAYNQYLKGEEEHAKVRMPLARQYFRKAVELDPNFAMALRHLGGESLKKAMALSKKVTEKERLYIEIDHAQQIEKNNPKAISLYRQLVHRYPKEKIAFEHLGHMIAAYNPQEAIQMYRKALELDPNYGMAWNTIGGRFLDLKQYEEAIEAFKKYVSLKPGDANSHDSLADAYFQFGRLDEALENYSKALQVDPSFYTSYLATGYIYALGEDYARASEWVDKSIGFAIERFQPNVFQWKAFYMAWQGNLERSLGYIQMAENAAAAQKYEWAKAYADRLRAWIYYDKGELELSRKYNESSSLALIKSEPYAGESFHRIAYDYLGGLLDLKEGKVESARSKAAEMNSLISDVWLALNYRDLAKFETEWLSATIALHEKSFEKALTSFQEAAALKFVPLWVDEDYLKFRYNTPFQRDDLAREFVKRGDLDEAITEYESLITFNPKAPSRALVHPLYHYRLGKLYEQKGLTEKAAAQYQRFLDLWREADSGRLEVEDAKKRLAALDERGS